MTQAPLGSSPQTYEHSLSFQPAAPVQGSASDMGPSGTDYPHPADGTGLGRILGLEVAEQFCSASLPPTVYPFTVYPT